jgi:hypothetical protein
MIHGIGHQFSHREELCTAWRTAISTGLHDSHLPGLGPDDIEMVTYGNCFRAAGRKDRAGSDGTEWMPPVRPEDLTDDFEMALLAAIAAELETVEGAKIYLPGSVQSLVRLIEASDLLPDFTRQAVVWLVKEVHRYLHEPATRACVLNRLESTVGPDTRVIVAHSLGSVVAYEALCAHPEWKINSLVTLGSPLGWASLGALLTPPVRGGRGSWPNVATWVNVAAREDGIAIVKELKHTFAKVDDRPIRNRRRHAHAAEEYLTSAECVSAIVDGLR